MNKIFLFFTVSACLAQDIVTTPPFTEHITNAPVVIGTFPDNEPCPICHSPSHHEFQLVRYYAYDVVKQTTEFKGQKKTHIIFIGPTTNWLATNTVLRTKSKSPGFSSPPPLP